MIRAALRSALLIWGVAAVPGALAESLQDPTRPPSSISIAQDGPGLTGVAGPQLQSVLIGRERKTAIISGQAVSIGDKVGDAVVVRITEGEVVLRSGSDLQTLKLFPGIEKRMTADRAAPKPESRGKQR